MPGLRLVFAAGSFSAALGLGGVSFLGVDSGVDVDSDANDRVTAKKAMVATVFEHTEIAPVDIMLGHQLRMLTSSRKNVAQVAVINAKVAGVDNPHGTEQDPVLAQMARSYGTTGSVEVVELEADLAKKTEMLQRVFSVNEGSTAAFAKHFFTQELSTPELKREMVRFTAMLQFFDLCHKAEYGVDLCVNMRSESFLYRKDKKGLIELTSELFDNDEDVVALQPPTYCDYHQAQHRPAWAKGNQWTNSSFTKCQANSTKARYGEPMDMVYSRERLSSVMPITVSKNDLNLQKGFDHAFWLGMSRQGAVKGMACGHSFAIHKSSDKSMCKGRQMPLKQQANANSLSALQDKKAEQRVKLDTLSGEYSLFDQVFVRGLEVFTDRLENGGLPLVSGNVGNKCQDMCPNRDRILKEGTAW